MTRIQLTQQAKNRIATELESGGFNANYLPTIWAELECLMREYPNQASVGVDIAPPRNGARADVYAYAHARDFEVVSE